MRYTSLLNISICLILLPDASCLRNKANEQDAIVRREDKEYYTRELKRSYGRMWSRDMMDAEREDAWDQKLDNVADHIGEDNEFWNRDLKGSYGHMWSRDLRNGNEVGSTEEIKEDNEFWNRDLKGSYGHMWSRDLTKREESDGRGHMMKGPVETDVEDQEYWVRDLKGSYGHMWSRSLSDADTRNEWDQTQGKRTPKVTLRRKVAPRALTDIEDYDEWGKKAERPPKKRSLHLRRNTGFSS